MKIQRHISFGSIEQFRTVSKNVQTACHYQNKDKDGLAFYNRLAVPPRIVAHASEKIHGTNAAVCYTEGEFWIQSRNKIITVAEDNAGCAAFIEHSKQAWLDILHILIKENNIDTSDKIVSIFFEWAGGNIQKISAISGLEKQAIIFQHFKVSPREKEPAKPDNEINSFWLETRSDTCGWVGAPQNNIHNVMKHTHWMFAIDFANTDHIQNMMLEYIDKIEHDSPFGKAMGIKGNTGEGMVVTFDYLGSLHRFKVKGAKHSATKVKVLPPVDEELEQIKRDFAAYACSAQRLEQAWQAVFGISNESAEPSIQLLGSFLRWVHSDIVKEESDILDYNGLTKQDVNKNISLIAKTWFIEQLET